MSRRVELVNAEPAESGSRCKALTKERKPCRAPATENGLCYLHAHPEKAAELGRVGGQRNRHVLDTQLSHLPPLDSVSNVICALAQVSVELYAGRLHPKAARALSPLLSSLMRGLGMEQELRELRDQLKQLRERVDKLHTENGMPFSEAGERPSSASTA